MSYRCRNSRDSLERHEVKVAYAQGPRRKGERGRLDMGMSVHGAVHMDSRTAHTRITRRDCKIFGVSRTPAETMCAFGERGPAKRWFAALHLGQVPQREARSVNRADAVHSRWYYMVSRV